MKIILITISSIYRIRSLRIIRKCHFGDRAAQFAPFAALTGHDAIKETARLTRERLELSEKRLLNEKINIIEIISV